MEKMLTIIFFRGEDGKLFRCETREDFNKAMCDRSLTLLLGYPLDKLEEEYAQQ